MLLRDTQRPSRLPLRAAFTLMELLVVMAIIVIIAGFGGYYVLGRLDEAKVTQAKIRAKNIYKAMENYKIDHDEYPADLTALLTKSAIGKGPYLTNQEEILDPWGRQYQIDLAGAKGLAGGNTIAIPDVFTQTPDGRTVGNYSDNKK